MRTEKIEEQRTKKKFIYLLMLLLVEASAGSKDLAVIAGSKW